MKALKGIFIYMGIVILSIILICAFIVGIMFFTKTSMFGYYFLQVNENQNKVTEIDLTKPLDVELSKSVTRVNLNIETNNYGIIIKPFDSRLIQVLSNNNYIGLVEATKTEDGNVAETLPVVAQTVDVVTEGESSTVNVTLKFTEPEGLISFSDLSTIVVNVPFSISDKIVQYEINAVTGNGHIELTNSVNDKGNFEFPLTVAGLNLTTNKGDVVVKGFGDETGKETSNLKLTNLNIKTNGGTFDFTKFDTVTVDNKITLDSQKATYNFKTLKSHKADTTGGLEITGTTVKFTAERVECGSDGFIYKAETGLLKIDKLYTGELTNNRVEIKEKNDKGEEIATGKFLDKITKVAPYENTIFTDSAEVDLGVVVGKVGLYNEYGNVTIDMLSNQASMRTENGNILIGQSGVLLNEVDGADDAGNIIADNISYADTSALILYSTFGDITVGSYYQDAVVYSKKGKINVYSKYLKCKEVDDDNDESTPPVPVRYYYSNISTKDGQITAKTDQNPMIIEATDSATINFTILDVLTTKHKDLNVNMNPFKDADMYQAITKNGTVNVTFPLRSYKVKVEADRIDGSIGATTKFDKESYVQINNESDIQPTIRIAGRKAVLKSAV